MSSTLQVPEGQEGALFLPGNIRIHLYPKTKMTLLRPTALPSEKGVEHVQGYQIRLFEGQLKVEMPTSTPGESKAVAIFLPNNAEAIVWRGKVEIIGSLQDNNLITVYEGKAFAGLKRWLQLPAHTTLFFEKKDERGQKIPLPEAPVWDVLHPEKTPSFFGVVSHQAEIQSVDFTWSPQQQKLGQYRIELATDSPNSTVAYAAQTREPHASFALTAGVYEARLQSIASNGVPSQCSLPAKVRVLYPMAQPTLSILPDGLLVAPPNCPIVLNSMQNLEVAVYDTQKRPTRQQPPPKQLVYLPWTQPLTVGETPFRTLYIKETGGTVIDSLVLARRALQGEILFSPASPRWPGQPLEITARIVDPTGLTDTTHTPFQVVVQINGEKIALQGQREGAVWKGHIDPGVPPGPWLVEVSLRTEAGEIANQFLGIDGSPRLPENSDAPPKPTTKGVQINMRRAGS